MTDWKAAALARQLNISGEARDGIALALDSLEAAFRPLVSQLSYEAEPAFTLSEAAVDGE